LLPRLFVAFAGIAVAALAADSGIVRIKAGVTAPHKDETGVVWQADTGFTGGDVVGRDDNLAIANTKTPSLYRTERYSMTSFTGRTQGAGVWGLGFLFLTSCRRSESTRSPCG